MNKYRIKRINDRYYPQKRFCLFFWVYFDYESSNVITFDYKNAAFTSSLNTCQDFLLEIKKCECNKKPIVQIYPYD